MLRSSNSSAVLARLKLLTATDTDTSLAFALGVSPQTLSSWKGRESTPYSLCVELAVQHGVCLDWLLLGVGPRHRHPDAQALPVAATLPHEMTTLLHDLTEEDLGAVRQLAQDRKRLRALEGEIAELRRRLHDA